ncbi:MAG: SPOR domain-containing protein [Desulfobulbaceae bacterium]|nr:SPOR domain-containing protein [Desulfobulbaceae bacterium]
MALPTKRPHSFAIRFELGILGLGGLTVVCLCIFLWLFMLGVWAGQTVLSPSATESSPTLRRLTSPLLPPVESVEEPNMAPPPVAETTQLPPETLTPEEAVAPETSLAPEEGVVTEETATQGAPVAPSVPSAPSAPSVPVAPGAVHGGGAEAPRPSRTSYFTLQVGAFRDAANASQSVTDWQAKGYQAFSLLPEDGGGLTRVFVGRFDKLAEANGLVAEFEKKEKLRAYITLLPAAKEEKAEAKKETKKETNGK